MTIDLNIEKSRQDAVRIAESILQDKLGIIEGAMKLTRIGHELLNDDIWDDKDFSVLAIFNSETDHLPVGEERRLWDPLALAGKNKEIAEIENEAREKVIIACRSICNRFRPA